MRFAYEWHDDSSHWYRSYGNENWEFDEHGLMRTRIASINDLPIAASDRKYHWPLGLAVGRHTGLNCSTSGCEPSAHLLHRARNTRLT